MSLEDESVSDKSIRCWKSWQIFLFQSCILNEAVKTPFTILSIFVTILYAALMCNFREHFSFS